MNGAWCALALAAAAPITAAQTDSSAHDAPPLATLTPWADAVWLALLDRDGSYFGRLSDAGTFQRFNPLMDDEYELDLWTGLFTPLEEAQWTQSDEGVRIAGASINHPFILNSADWRARVPITGAVDFLARFTRRHSLSEQRDYPAVGVEWREALGAWSLRTVIGMHFFKSSADVEIGVRRGPLELRVAVLDAFNNLIFAGLGVAPEETPAHFEYASPPVAARLAFSTRAHPWRLELQVGGSTRSTVQVSFPSSGDPTYSLAEQVGFAGGLVEVHAASRIALVAFATVASATTQRRFPAPSPADLSIRERTSGIGARARVALAPALALELDGRVTWRPEARRTGTGAIVSHRDREHTGAVTVARRPRVGWLGRLGIAVVDRDAGVLAAALTARHARQLMEGGYRFRSGFEIAGGLRWDLDQLPHHPFDGGHLRLTATW